MHAPSTTATTARITFIDTPGHEAFTAMRARGAQVTDIAILVVAADDGVMPQTIEALNHAKAADVPIVVAVNKIDKEDANPTKVRQQLTEYGLVAEEYGGDTMFVDVSAKAGLNIDELLEAVLLTADAALDLRANPDTRTRRASRSRRTSTAVAVRSPRCWSSAARCASATRSWPATPTAGSGPCSTSTVTTIDEAGPSRPVQVLGLTSVPGAGDNFLVVDDDRIARQIAEKREAARAQRRAGQGRASRSASRTSTRLLEQGEIETLNLILKGDVSGSVEALEDALLKIDVGDEVSTARHPPRCRCDHREQRQPGRGVRRDHHRLQRPARGQGARAGRPRGRRRSATTRSSTRRSRRSRRRSRACSSRSSRRSSSARRRSARSSARPSSATSPAAGALGELIRRNAKARLIRDGAVVADNLEIASLRRFKDDATEVREGFECGIDLGIVQRHQGRRRHRDLRDAREAARLIRSPGPVRPRDGGWSSARSRLDLLLGDVGVAEGEAVGRAPVVAELRRRVRGCRRRDRATRTCTAGPRSAWPCVSADSRTAARCSTRASGPSAETAGAASCCRPRQRLCSTTEDL